VYADPPKTSGPLVPFLWLFCLGSIPLLIPDLPHCCPIKLLGLWINDSLLLCSDSSLAYWCSHVISITLSLLHFWNITQLMTHSLTNQFCHAAYSFLYSAAYSCSLCLLIYVYPLLTDRLQSPYKALTNPWQILFTPFSFCTLMLCPPMYLNPWAQPSEKKDPIAWNYPSLSLSQSVSPQLLESCRLQWRSKGSDISSLFNPFKSKYFSRLKQSLASQSFTSHSLWMSGAPLPLCCTNLWV